jgi:hypothetical protein
MASEADIRQRYEQLAPALNERQRRLWAAAEANAAGYGGVTLVARATGVSRKRINRGRRELAAGEATALPPERSRRSGAGRKPLEVVDETLWPALEALVEPTARGDPMSPLRWTALSLHRLADCLCGLGYRISHTKVGELLKAHHYRQQGNRKSLEGGGHPDRDAQFQYRDAEVAEFLAAGEPVVSVDTKKKELVGDYKNCGREWRPQGQPEEVKVHDFVDQQLGRAVPYGVYDVAHNEGWVNVGVSHDTAAFAVASLRCWWQELGSLRYPAAGRLLICADGGGSNGSRTRLWKTELQRFADETGLTLTVCHLPPGTSKWNPIEHKLFCFITINWRGQPLRSYQTIVSLIGATTTAAGLTVRCELDPREYAAGVEVSDEELQQVRLTRHAFHGDWNYTIAPRSAT